MTATKKWTVEEPRMIEKYIATGNWPAGLRIDVLDERGNVVVQVPIDGTDHERSRRIARVIAEKVPKALKAKP